MIEMDKQVEMTQELRRARGWILAAGIVFFVFNWVEYAIEASKYPEYVLSIVRSLLWKITAPALVVSIGLFFFAKYKPVAACVLGLCAYWGLQIYLMAAYNTPFYSGLIMKVFFTVAMVRGIKSGSRAQTLQSELGTIFE